MKKQLLPFLLLMVLWTAAGSYAKAQKSAMESLTIQNGVCQISTPEDLANFALAVNDGNTTLNAIVTQDLDFSSFNGEFSGIALEGVPYLGTFDGQGHRIKNLTIDGKGEYFAGLFRMVGNGSVIKNLIMDKTCSIINGGNACAMIASNDNKVNSTVTLIGLGNEGTVESKGTYVGAIASINYGFNAYYIIQDCWSTGSVTGGSYVAQISGHLGHGSISGCWSTAEVTCKSGTTLLFDYIGDATFTDCYTLGGSDATPFTEEELANGSLCYKLNGDQSNIRWTQTIGQDAQPQYGLGSKQVYASGALRCDGTEYPDKPLTYTNTESQPEQLEHQYGEDGFCTICGRTRQNEEGYYLVGTAGQLNWVAQKVQEGETDIKVLLTSDIDLSSSDYPMLMIGTSNAKFGGIFDGGGYTVTYSYDVSSDYSGLFCFVNNATIRNLRVNGSAVVPNIHFGALIGRADGTVLVENVVTNVDITGVRSGVTGDAGMLGANYGNVTFNDCATLGTMGGEGSSMYCGFVAYDNSAATTTLNNCFTTWTLTEGTGLDYCYTFCRTNGKVTLNNCYYLNEIGTAQGTPVTEEQIANGALCYKLNGDQSTIRWTQTIGQDALPQYGLGSKQVYASGTLRCDGMEFPEKPLTYGNTETYPTIPDHQYNNDGICIICGLADPDAVKTNEEGYCLIGNAKQFNWVALKISEGTTDMKVLLTDDIDLSGSDFPNLMLGSQANPFQGIFDGGGHSVTYNYEVAENYSGLFRYVNNATIRNLIVNGSAVVPTIHFGALIGRADGTVLVENVVTNVDIEGTRSGVTGDGGMLGANYANITFNNCSTHGTMGSQGSSMYCGFVAYDSSSATTTLNNCYTTCTLVEETGLDYCYTFCRTNGKVTLNNCYYLNTIGTVQGISVTEEQIVNGALCYMLNGDQSNTPWRQNLDEDVQPVPFEDHLKVYGAGEVYMNITDDAGFKDFMNIVIEEDTNRYGELKTQKSLVTTYLEALETLISSSSIDVFLQGYAELAPQRKSIESCAEAYNAYIAKVEETKLYLEEHPELSNEKSELLNFYLTEYDDPNEDFPHGSSVCILETCELSEEEISAETGFVEKMLSEAISFTPSVGTDITLLFTNADLKDGFNGWEGKVGTSIGCSETSPIYAAECFNNTMDMYQTLSGLQNGIYELQVNGAFRPYPYDDYYNTNYAATLYANGIHNYFQTNIEDMISAGEAVDGENCHISDPIADFSVLDMDGNLAGYTMQGVLSCSNAFKAGRYPNSVLCEVTDGTLTIGIRQPGSGQQPDWLGFGNIKVIYWGQLADATEGLDHVLTSQSDRARTILETYQFSFGPDYATYPNFSQALKDELKQTLDAVATTTDAEGKYRLIEKFSSLFLQIYECKQAYITLMKKAEEVNDLMGAFSNLIDENEFLQMEEIFQKLTDAYIDGTMSAEEALAVDPKEQITLFPDVVDGYYQLKDLANYVVFATMVNSGSTKLNAKLLTDIDLHETDYQDLMIGASNAQYGGIFDGGGHTITYNYNITENYCGLFSYVSSATIRNLQVNSTAIVPNIHFGALMGRAEGDVLVENVVTNVDITGTRSGVTGNAGMLGANYGNVTFNNCATHGTLGGPGSSMYCGFVAWDDGSHVTTLNNCYTTCSLVEGTGLDYCYTFCRTNGKVVLNNCYYLNEIGNAQGTKMASEQFQSGEVCYRLNGEQNDIQWYQTIGEDEYPILDKSHGIVSVGEDGTYSNTTGVESISAQEPANKGAIYNLQGQKVQTLSKGIYIVGQKKILVK